MFLVWPRFCFILGFISVCLLVRMLSTRLGTSSSPIVIDSDIEESPVKVVEGDKFR